MSQKTNLEKIYKNNDKAKADLDKLRQLLVVNIYKSLVERTNYRKKVSKLIGVPRNLLTYCIKIYDKIKKIDPKTVKVPDYELGDAANSIVFAYLIMNKYKTNDNARVIADDYNRKQLGEEKEAYIMSEIQENRLNEKYFYLCSSHNDSAEDHRPWQGKLYIDANCKDDECLALANQYHMQTYQWVIGAPVYMVTRPNCRHYFKALSYNEVKGKSYNQLIEENKMHRKIGERGDRIQTMNTRGKKIEFVIKSYEDRLRVHQEMLKIRPNEMLRRAIEKDVLLIRKWKKAI